MKRCTTCDSNSPTYHLAPCPNGGGGRIGGHNYNIHLTGVSYHCACGCRMSPFSSKPPDDNTNVDPFGVCPRTPHLNHHGWPTKLAFTNGFRCACGSWLDHIESPGPHIGAGRALAWLKDHLPHVEHLITQPAPQPPQPELPMPESTTPPTTIDQFFDLVCEVTGRGKMVNHGQPWAEAQRRHAIVVDKDGEQVADCSTEMTAKLLIGLNDVADELLAFREVDVKHQVLITEMAAMTAERDQLAAANKEMVYRFAHAKAQHASELTQHRITGRHENHDKHGGAAKNNGVWCAGSCSACGHEAEGRRGALAPIDDLLRRVGYTGETIDMVKELYARNCELVAAAASLESIDRFLETHGYAERGYDGVRELNAKFTQYALERSASADTKLVEENAELTALNHALAANVAAIDGRAKALRVALVYAMSHRGSSFDFDTWKHLYDDAMDDGVVTPHAMEDEITLRQQITASLNRVRAERDGLRERFETLCKMVVETADTAHKLAFEATAAKVAAGEAPVSKRPLHNLMQVPDGIAGSFDVKDTIGTQSCRFQFKDGALYIDARETPILIPRETVAQLFVAWQRG